MTLDQKIEAVLFLKGEPVSVKKLAELLEVTGEEIEASLEILTDRIKEGGLNLVIKGNEFKSRLIKIFPAVGGMRRPFDQSANKKIS